MPMLQAERDTLLKPLTSVTGIVERRQPLPILANVLIEKSGDTLSFLATDLEIQITSRQSEGIGGDDFRLTTSAKKLQDILRALPESATVSFEHADHRLVVKAGRSRFYLQTLDAGDFPVIAVASEPKARLDLTCGGFKSLLARVQYAMAVQDIRYYLNGLLFVAKDQGIQLVATDGHRLAFASLASAQQNTEAEAILPRKTIIELARLLPDSDDALTIELLDNQVRFIFGQTTIVSKVVDGKFPDYKRVIPLDNDKIILVQRQDFLTALSRAAILANEKFHGVRLVLADNRLSIVCTNSDQEAAEEELEIDYNGEPFESGFNIHYLRDVLSNLHVSSLQIAFGDSARSTLFTIPDDASFKYVVMPMRI